MGKKKREPSKPSTAWQGTYGDMITLMLCFFVMLYDPSETDTTAVADVASALSIQTQTVDTPATNGGQSLTAGRLADLGNTVNSLPSVEMGKSLGMAKKKAVSLFAPDVRSSKITISSDERGLIITLASDTFFKQGSADLDIENTRDSLLRLSQFLQDPELAKRRIRIEGHTDSSPVPPESEFPSNWELSAARSANVLHFLGDFGINQELYSIAGYADTMPKFSNDTEEGRAYNRRVDIIILDEGHF